MARMRKEGFSWDNLRGENQSRDYSFGSGLWTWWFTKPYPHGPHKDDEEELCYTQ